MTGLDCLIPAAGRSRRMGSWKPALSWRGVSVVETVVETARSAGCRVIILGGEKTDSLRQIIGRRNGVELYYCPRWHYGMDATIRSGLEYLKSERFFIVPVDMPLIRSEDYQHLADIPGDMGLRPEYKGVPGHPVLLNSRHAALIRHAPDGIPIRKLLAKEKITSVSWPHAGVVSDFDTASEYESMHQKHG